MDFLFDARWLALTGTAVSALVAMLFGLGVWLARPRTRVMVLWAWSAVWLFLGQCFGLLKLELQQNWTAVAANVFLTLTMAWVLRGTHVATGTQDRPRLYLAGVALMAGITISTFGYGTPEIARPVGFALLSMALLGASIWLLWRAPTALRAPARAMALVLVVFPLAFAAYAWGSVTLAAAPNHAFAAQVITVSFLIASIAPVLLAATMWAVIRAHRRQLTP
jgi:hypothetical protein